MSPHKPEIASMIIAYLLKHPAAKDSLQGIASWWILKQQLDLALDDVSDALDYLVFKEFVVVKKFENQPRFFQLNESKLPEIRAALVDLQESK